MSEAIPEDIVELLRTRMGSLEQLEVLLILAGDDTRAWALGEIAQRLSMPETHLAEELGGLVGAGLVVGVGAKNEGWRYDPRDPSVRGTITRLAEIYPQRRLEFIRLLSTLAMQRIRDGAARAFADAFVIGRKKDG